MMRMAEPARNAHPEILTQIDDARRDYQRAIAYFDSVNEPELVDRAVYLLCAAECRHAYLIRLARSEGIGQVPELGTTRGQETSGVGAESRRDLGQDRDAGGEPLHLLG